MARLELASRHPTNRLAALRGNPALTSDQNALRAWVEAASSRNQSPLQKITPRRCRGVIFWSGRRGSNSLPPPWQGGALPDELRPHGGEFGFVALSPGDECYYMAFDVKSQAFFAYFFKKSYVYCFSTVSGQFFSRSFRSTLYCLPQNWQLTSAMGSSSRSFSTSFLPRLRMVRSTRSRLQSQQ